MILAVTEHFHDHEPQSYCLDTDSLDPNDYISGLILKECKKKSRIIRVYVDASNWEDHLDKFGNEGPEVSGQRVKNPDHIDKSLNITIDFDC